MSATVELRPFPPFLPPQATVIMMGSFPPTAKEGHVFSLSQFSK